MNKLASTHAVQRPMVGTDTVKGRMWIIQPDGNGYIIYPVLKPEQACGVDELPSWLLPHDLPEAEY